MYLTKRRREDREASFVSKGAALQMEWMARTGKWPWQHDAYMPPPINGLRGIRISDKNTDLKYAASTSETARGGILDIGVGIPGKYKITPEQQKGR